MDKEEDPNTGTEWPQRVFTESKRVLAEKIRPFPYFHGVEGK